VEIISPMSKTFSPYRDFEQVGWSCAKAVLRTEGDGSGQPERAVALRQDYPLRPPPPVQFVLCFDEAEGQKPGSPDQAECLIGFREQDGTVMMLRATPWDVAKGLEKLRRLMLRIAQSQKLSTGK
jgi:hypothetical protein